MAYQPSNFENDMNQWNDTSKYLQDCRECWESFLAPEYFYCAECRDK